MKDVKVSIEFEFRSVAFIQHTKRTSELSRNYLRIDDVVLTMLFNEVIEMLKLN